MLGIADYWAFVIAVIIFLMLPGPGTFCLLTSTGKGGFRAGAAATFGVILGDQVLLWLAALGVAALLQAHPLVFQGLQYAGAAYLCYLGLRLVLAKDGDAPVLNIRPYHYLRQAMWITLLNPKAIVFYMAFFPLFIDPQRHQGFMTFAIMSLTIAVISLIYCLSLCAGAHWVAERIKRHRGLTRWLERVAGVFLIGFGFKLTIH
ncbi:MAG: LysE family transporter [Burkholderiales bacterium]|jgi:threonine/homoserine/homoserine lactone efflux protein|nr:LysE family transporter [Burkholderiales bacterium]MCA3160954.1 LysE family transporter [Burkholderiales bacterium]MCA3166089.1 LysE family transporter [Burkholderiales bacterium]MCA3169266.1 LysE family transporter [Burkholderiales bacterium]MCA3171674.1 LysE family transporter [Burkholderiales bacterium]